jgi:uncharacterized protein (TIGR00290 family)
MEKEKVVLFWSGGKDSAFALYKISEEKKYNVVALITTVNSNYGRISMHGVREVLLDEQARSIGIPLVKMYVNQGTNSEYESKLKEILFPFKKQGVSKVIYGDIFLEDLRIYREKLLSEIGFTAEFPLWKLNTEDLIRDFLALGFKTITCCINLAYLDETWAGRIVDNNFINDLPDNVDPCGENGEYHTFCFDGPIFKKAILFDKGEKIFRPLDVKIDEKCPLPAFKTEGFIFCDLLFREN